MKNLKVYVLMICYVVDMQASLVLTPPEQLLLDRLSGQFVGEKQDNILRLHQALEVEQKKYQDIERFNDIVGEVLSPFIQESPNFLLEELDQEAVPTVDFVVEKITSGMQSVEDSLKAGFFNAFVQTCFVLLKKDKERIVDIIAPKVETLLELAKKYPLTMIDFQYVVIFTEKLLSKQSELIHGIQFALADSQTDVQGLCDAIDHVYESTRILFNDIKATNQQLNKTILELEKMFLDTGFLPSLEVKPDVPVAKELFDKLKNVRNRFSTLQDALYPFQIYEGDDWLLV